jgi:hypothetical protein
MRTKTLIVFTILASSLFAAQVQARPDLTPEQLAKARETASQMKPPVDFDAMLDEIDRLGVECTGDLTRKIRIESCRLRIDTAQSKERQEKLREENAKLDKEAIQMINDIADKADKKLKRTQ